MQYSLVDMINRYRRYKKENYDDESDSQKVIMGMSQGLFAIIVILSFAIWIWALVVLVIFWRHLPDWAKVVGILGLLPIVPGGSIITLVTVYIAKGNHKYTRFWNPTESRDSVPMYNENTGLESWVSAYGTPYTHKGRTRYAHYST